MPIYEFYCKGCHTIYSFLSRRINTETTPLCPGCGPGAELSRRVSRFAVVAGGRSQESDDPLEGAGINESVIERAVEGLASEAQSIGEDDPRAAARLMRKLSEMTGLRYNDTLQEALARLESGEDPEAIEQELGDTLESDDLPFSLKGGAVDMRTCLPPRRDETLYEM